MSFTCRYYAAAIRHHAAYTPIRAAAYADFAPLLIDAFGLILLMPLLAAGYVLHYDTIRHYA